MKKILCFALLFLISIMLIQPVSTKSKEKIDRGLMNDTLLALLNPAIERAIENYYGYQKSYGLYDAKILDIKRKEGNGQYDFLVKVGISTFVAAHNPPYGEETILLEVGIDKVSVLEFSHKGDEYEKMIARFYDETISDIKATFALDLDSFQKLAFDQLSFKAENDKDFESLSAIVASTNEKEIDPEIIPPDKNVIQPVTLIKGNHGYILFKKANGLNVMLEVARTDGKWVVVNRREKQGKKMKKELLWYM